MVSRKFIEKFREFADGEVREVFCFRWGKRAGKFCGGVDGGATRCNGITENLVTVLAYLTHFFQCAALFNHTQHLKHLQWQDLCNRAFAHMGKDILLQRFQDALSIAF
ncbi:hypothetical protein D3C76_1158760 [compost metagenome]